ncbi:MAG: hypothetical protein KDD50_13985 [Bdellovibrionales bacterium]|nr:hypothetical protein [Bdellovibrionales bacterium]
MGNDAKKSKKTHAIQDNRCDDDFIAELAAKESCFKSGDVAGCSYLASMGVGAGSTVQFLANIRKNLSTSPGKYSPDYKKTSAAFKQRLKDQVLYEKYKNIYNRAEVLANEKLSRELLGKDPHRRQIESGVENHAAYVERLKKERAEHVRKISKSSKFVDELPSKWGGYKGYGFEDPLMVASEIRSQLEVLMADEKDIEMSRRFKRMSPNYISPYDFELLLQTERAESFESKFPREMSRYKKWQAEVERKLLDYTRELYASHEQNNRQLTNEVTELERKLRAALNEPVDTNDEIAKKAKNQKIMDLQEELRPKQNRLQEIVDHFFKGKETLIEARRLKLQSEFAKANPKVFLIGNMTEKYPSTGLNRMVDMVYRMSKKEPSIGELSKGYARAGLIGAGVFLAAEGAVNIIADHKLNLCAKELMLSDDEVELANSMVADKKAGGACRNIGFENYREMLTKAKAKFGFVPKGLCGMALRANSLYKSITEGLDVQASDCTTIEAKDLTLNTGEEREDSYKCDAGKIQYNMPIIEITNSPNFERVQASLKKDPSRNASIYANRMRSSARIMSSMFAPSGHETPNSWKQIVNRCLNDSKDRAPICICARGFMVLRSAALVNSLHCPSIDQNGQEKDPAPKKDGII